MPLYSAHSCLCFRQGPVLAGHWGAKVGDNGGPRWATMTKMRDTVLFSKVLKGRDMPPTHFSGHKAESEG